MVGRSELGVKGSITFKNRTKQRINKKIRRMNLTLTVSYHIIIVGRNIMTTLANIMMGLICIIMIDGCKKEDMYDEIK